MKKIINKVEDIVTEMCEGLVSAHPELLEVSQKYKIVKRKNLNKDKVTLISGGGSGHEPAHAGCVGTGMLDAAVCGDIFASPSIIQVYNAIVETRSNKGTLLIIKNYSGDCMNFDSAAEMAEEDDGIAVAKVYVNDDVAVEDSLHTVGRRGVAGTIFVQKIAGAAAEKGWSLEEVKRIAEKVISNVRTISIALAPCTVPANGSPTFSLSDSEIEFGVGIHGEPGVSRESMASADEFAEKMVRRITADVPFNAGEEIAVMVNGLGSTPLQELYVLNRSVSKLLASMGLKTYKTLVGNYMTAIDMKGASITLLKLDAELKELLDAPVEAAVLRGQFNGNGNGNQ